MSQPWEMKAADWYLRALRERERVGRLQPEDKPFIKTASYQAHERSVKEAIERGDPVPFKVLADYEGVEWANAALRAKPVELERIGDFYEAFDGSADVIAHVLGVTKMVRNRRSLAGIPYHLVDRYVSRLRGLGYTVSVKERTP
jgi:hypothetical protein